VITQYHLVEVEVFKENSAGGTVCQRNVRTTIFTGLAKLRMMLLPHMSRRKREKHVAITDEVYIIN
jgi:hypothetical protein